MRKKKREKDKRVYIIIGLLFLLLLLVFVNKGMTGNVSKSPGGFYHGEIWHASCTISDAKEIAGLFKEIKIGNHCAQVVYNPDQNIPGDIRVVVDGCNTASELNAWVRACNKEMASL